MAKSNNFGIKAVFNLYDIKLLIKGAKSPFIITSLIVILFYFFGEIKKDTLSIVVDLILSIIPSLLGFVLSGYALLIGFGNIEVIAKKPKYKQGDNPNKPTLYQRVSTVFAFGLIIQIFLLVITFVIKLILKLDLPCLINTFGVCNAINYIIFIMLVFGLLYVTVMIKDLVINIFNFSQVQHIFINKKNKTIE